MRRRPRKVWGFGDAYWSDRRKILKMKIEIEATELLVNYPNLTETEIQDAIRHANISLFDSLGEDDGSYLVSAIDDILRPLEIKKEYKLTDEQFGKISDLKNIEIAAIFNSRPSFDEAYQYLIDYRIERAKAKAAWENTDEYKEIQRTFQDSGPAFITATDKNNWTVEGQNHTDASYFVNGVKHRGQPPKFNFRPL